MPADRTSSTAEQLRKSWFGAKSGRPVNAINPITALMQAELDLRRTNGGSVRPEDRNTCPSPEVLQLQQRADQLQLELERTKQALQLQQRADQLQLELERTKKDLSLTKQGFELDGVFGNKADIVSETNIINKVKSLNDCIYQLALLCSSSILRIRFHP
ncbi:hypothetical protein F5887DRAFT_675458 [Amanita rubescens]|nr:hypothetical protein F5887DRAFT_675458 [Amanita rubescens]